MKRILVIALCLVLLVVGCSSPPNLTKKQGATSINDSPKLIKQWRGSGVVTTESFTVTQKQWSLKLKALDTDGWLTVFVYNKDAEMISDASITKGKLENVSYVSGAGEVYLKIVSSNTRWEVTVEE